MRHSVAAWLDPRDAIVKVTSPRQIKRKRWAGVNDGLYEGAPALVDAHDRWWAESATAVVQHSPDID
jgi:hypothetical protein